MIRVANTSASIPFVYGTLIANVALVARFFVADELSRRFRDEGDNIFKSLSTVKRHSGLGPLHSRNETTAHHLVASYRLPIRTPNGSTGVSVLCDEKGVVLLVDLSPPGTNVARCCVILKKPR